MTIVILGKANSISLQLAAIQKLGIVNNGPPIWDSRKDVHPDFLAVKK